MTVIIRSLLEVVTQGNGGAGLEFFRQSFGPDRDQELGKGQACIDPEFDGIDTGDDDLLNRILWFAAKGNIPYPARYAGSESDERNED